MVAIAESNSIVVENRHRRFIRGNPIKTGKHRKGLLNRISDDRLPLDGIAWKQRRTGLPLERASQLPGQVIRIGNAGICPKGTSRRHDMCRIANKKDVLLLKRCGGPGCGGPGAYIENLDGQVGKTNRRAYHLDSAFPGKVFLALALVWIERRKEREALAVAGKDQRGSWANRGVEDKADGKPAPAQSSLHVGGEENAELVSKNTWTIGLGPKLLADTAAVPIGSDQVARPHGALRPASAISNHRTHSLGLLCKRYKFGKEAKIAA